MHRNIPAFPCSRPKITVFSTLRADGREKLFSLGTPTLCLALSATLDERDQERLWAAQRQAEGFAGGTYTNTELQKPPPPSSADTCLVE